MKSILPPFTFFILLISFSFFAAAQKPATALEMNDHFTSITDSLYKRGIAWGKKFNEAYQTKNFSTLTEVRKQLELFIEKKRKEVLLLPDIGGSEDLRLAMLDFLAFEAKMAKEAFIPLEKFNSSSSDAEIKKAIEALQEQSKGENLQIQKLTAAQQAYAKKNGFTITGNDEEGDQ